MITFTVRVKDNFAIGKNELKITIPIPKIAHFNIVNLCYCVVKFNRIIFHRFYFSAYPARQACKNIGGRLPVTREIIAIYNGRASYGNNFNMVQYQAYYWTASEFNGTSSMEMNFYTDDWGYMSKTNNGNVRCVVD